MTGNRCIVCGNTRSKGPEVSFHRFPVAKSNFVDKQSTIDELCGCYNSDIINIIIIYNMYIIIYKLYIYNYIIIHYIIIYHWLASLIAHNWNQGLRSWL